MYPNDAAVVSRAIEQAKNVRLNGPRPRRGLHGTGPVIIATDPTTGMQTIDDGAGNIVVNNPDGTNYRIQMNLANKVAWLQPPVYVAAGVGLVLGVAGFLAYKKYGRK